MSLTTSKITGLVGVGVITLGMALTVTFISQNTAFFGNEKPSAEVLGVQDTTVEPETVQESTAVEPEPITPVSIQIPAPAPEEPEPALGLPQDNNFAPVTQPTVSVSSPTSQAPNVEEVAPEESPIPEPTPDPDPEPIAEDPVPENPEPEPPVGDSTPDEPEPPIAEDPDGSGGWTPERFCAETGEELGMMLIWNGEVCVDTSGQAIRRPVDPIVPIRPVR